MHAINRANNWRDRFTCRSGYSPKDWAPKHWKWFPLVKFLHDASQTARTGWTDTIKEIQSCSLHDGACCWRCQKDSIQSWRWISSFVSRNTECKHCKSDEILAWTEFDCPQLMWSAKLSFTFVESLLLELRFAFPKQLEAAVVSKRNGLLLYTGISQSLKKEDGSSWTWHRRCQVQLEPSSLVR